MPETTILPHRTTSQSSAPATTQVRTYTVADLVCHLCGTLAGSIRSELPTLPRTVRFTAAGSQRTVDVLDWRRLRCARCGGTLFAEEIHTVRERLEPANLWEEERPRRGRPPKWLVEQRKREREEFERLTEAA